MNIEGSRLTMIDMRKPSRRLVRVAALVVVVAVASCLILRYRATSEALSREFDLAVQKKEAILTANMRRPVLRGEPSPGDGGALLEKALRDLDRQAGQYEERPVMRLARLLEDGGDRVKVDAAKRAFDEMRVCLSDVRDAIQHESCRLPQEADQTFWDQLLWERTGAIHVLGVLLLLEADL
ncbi:MAG: hypothetical protein O6952_00305, partial [Planctomycetota bacterium]|nr:hypothetical protein [Planctomycetota bacterium]